MALEQTLAIIKPDAVAKDLIGKISAHIEQHGLQIIAAKMQHLSMQDVQSLYQEHEGKTFYEPLLRFMTSGPVMVELLEGENAIQVLRDLMGATVPGAAETGTIRNLYADHEFNGVVHENAIHGSDSIENAKQEIEFFFADHEICPRTR